MTTLCTVCHETRMRFQCTSGRPTVCSTCISSRDEWDTCDECDCFVHVSACSLCYCGRQVLCFACAADPGVGMCTACMPSNGGYQQTCQVCESSDVATTWGSVYICNNCMGSDYIQCMACHVVLIKDCTTQFGRYVKCYQCQAYLCQRCFSQEEVSHACTGSRRCGLCQEWSMFHVTLCSDCQNTHCMECDFVCTKNTVTNND